MQTYNFDEIIDRHGTGAIKTDALQERFGRGDLTALWVADMDFATPPFIIDALNQRMKHPIFGYTAVPDDYVPCIADWIESHHGWQVKHEWIQYISGIVKGIGMVLNVFTKPGDGIIIQPPVYHPFRLVPEGNGRRIVNNPLIENADGTYSMDFDNLAKVADDTCKVLILSNPHNPAGIVWDADTLRRLAHFCSQHGILVISDEIHCDMALFGHRHSITFGAPSKTFNIAGIVGSYSIVPNDQLRHRFYSWLEANELGEPTIFSPIATIAAFRHGEEWRRQMLSYIEGNVLAVEKFCAEHLPGIKPLRPQASCLVWLDCRGLNLEHDQLIDLFVNRARLALNDGAMFGSQGNGFMRLNVGMPRSLLLAALENLRKALQQ